MAEILSWISNNSPLVGLASTVIVALATVVLVLMTGRYVRLTAWLVEETRKSREPFVTIDFEMLNRGLRLVVENRGLSSAKNIRFEVEQDLGWLNGRNGEGGLSKISVVKKGISYLSPSRQLKYSLGYPDWNNIPEDQKIISLQVSYEDDAGAKFEHGVEFNFDQMTNVLFESFKDPNTSIAEAIRDTERSQKSSKSHQDFFIERMSKKSCQMCAERIPVAAKKCSHCYEMQVSPEKEKNEDQGAADAKIE